MTRDGNLSLASIHLGVSPVQQIADDLRAAGDLSRYWVIPQPIITVTNHQASYRVVTVILVLVGSLGIAFFFKL